MLTNIRSFISKFHQFSNKSNFFAEGTPLRALDFCPISDNPLPLTGTALSLVGWIILGKSILNYQAFFNFSFSNNY